MKKIVAEHGDQALEFKAENRDDAMRILAENGYINYEIVWIEPDNCVTKELVSDGKGGHILRVKEE